MRRDDFVDFFAVEAHQQEIHKRLENWARSCFSGGGSSAGPMFRMYRSDDHWERTSPIPVDFADAAKIGKGVAALPQDHRNAIQWNYITGGSPTKARKKLGVTGEGLMRLIRDGRQMLINRNI